jgi:hypothetical protein
MAKAARKITPLTWIPLHEAHPLVIEICLSPSQAGLWLAEQIAAKRMRVRWRAVRPASTSAVEIEGFWQGSLPTLDFADNSATKLVIAPPGTVVGFCPITLLGIEIARQDIEPLLPVAAKKTADRPTILLEPKVWFEAARREHPQRRGEDLSAYAERLHGLMEAAPVKSVWSKTGIRRRLYGD